MLKEVDQDILIHTIQENVVKFCKGLSSHVEKCLNWLDETTKPVQALVNYSEQLRHVERANIKYIDGFKTLQESLIFKIYSEIEDELILIKGLLNRLNASNQDIKNKLVILEKSTADLDWEAENYILTGSAFQPPLSRILQDGYEFVKHFCDIYKSISDGFKTLNVRSEESMRDFENKFKVNVMNKLVTEYLAVLQYVVIN